MPLGLIAIVPDDIDRTRLSAQFGGELIAKAEFDRKLLLHGGLARPRPKGRGLRSQIWSAVLPKLTTASKRRSIGAGGLAVTMVSEFSVVAVCI
jgi:hypothetical protein